MTTTSDREAQTLDVTSWLEVTDSGIRQGSNQGGVYEDPRDGTRYYVKKSLSARHASNEALAAALYRLAGIECPDIKVVKLATGAAGTASPLVPRAKNDLYIRQEDPAYRKLIQQGFAVDAWLANWDVGGTDYGNIVTDEHGRPVRVDTGGALLYRARGAPKGSQFGAHVDEVETLRDPRRNPEAYDLFFDIDTATMQASVQRVAKITKRHLDAVLDEFHADPDLRTKLHARRRDIIRRFGATARALHPLTVASAGKPLLDVAPLPSRTDAWDVQRTQTLQVEERHPVIGWRLVGVIDGTSGGLNLDWGRYGLYGLRGFALQWPRAECFADELARLQPQLVRANRPRRHADVPHPACSCGYGMLRDLDGLTRFNNLYGADPPLAVGMARVAGWGTVVGPNPNDLDPDAGCIRVSHLKIVGPLLLHTKDEQYAALLIRRYPDLRGRISLVPDGLQNLTGGRT